jgi:hypothetical protein
LKGTLTANNQSIIQCYARCNKIKEYRKSFGLKKEIPVSKTPLAGFAKASIRKFRCATSF